MKYFLYIRKSTDEDDRQVLSLEAQETELKELKPYEKCEKCGNAPLPPELTKQITKALENAKSDKYSNDKD